MDRFIASTQPLRGLEEFNLKSSMDRFIGIYFAVQWRGYVYLKSSMDRFIDVPLSLLHLYYTTFKIQYG